MELKKTISRSYSRKLSLKHYGGVQYEMAEFFSSYSEEVNAETPKEELKRVSSLLYDMAKSDVEEAVAETIKSLSPAEDLKKGVEWANKVATGKEVHED